jgi:hypothetical protein
MDRLDILAHIADALSQLNLSIKLEDEEVEVGPLIGWAARELARLQKEKEKYFEALEGLIRPEVLAG